jgi:beta-fructofuranosidase
VHVLPVHELLAARGAGATHELSDGEATTMGPPVVPGPGSSGELEVDAVGADRLLAVTLVDTLGRRLRIETAAFAEVPGPLRLCFDGGIVEVFRGGLVGTWSDVGLQAVGGVEIEHTVAGAGTASWWATSRP